MICLVSHRNSDRTLPMFLWDSAWLEHREEACPSGETHSRRLLPLDRNDPEVKVSQEAQPLTWLWLSVALG